MSRAAPRHHLRHQSRQGPCRNAAPKLASANTTSKPIPRQEWDESHRHRQHDIAGDRNAALSQRSERIPPRGALPTATMPPNMKPTQWCGWKAEGAVQPLANVGEETHQPARHQEGNRQRGGSVAPSQKGAESLDSAAQHLRGGLRVQALAGRRSVASVVTTARPAKKRNARRQPKRSAICAAIGTPGWARQSKQKKSTRWRARARCKGTNRRRK